MIVVIDNYDSFTYNLVQFIGSTGEEVFVTRNDQMTAESIEELHPEKIVISPGPGYPCEAGYSMQVIGHFLEKCPILGVCLGVQSIGEALGGRVVAANELVHGKSSRVFHDGKTIFNAMKNPFLGGRYHSLVVERNSLPDCLEVSAETKEGLIMALRHREFPVEGVQFHPESILTEDGMTIIKNFLQLSS